MNALITGGAGFIGSHLVRALVQRGASVTVYDDLSQGSLSNLEDFRSDNAVSFIRANILDLDLLEKAMIGKTHVFHLAAMNSIPRSIDFPLESHAGNVTGTLNVLSAARKSGVRRVVYSSSSSVYGNQSSSFRTETMIPNPIAPYPLQKLVGEFYAKQFWELYGLETISLRYFNVFGPGQPVNSPYSAVIPKFIAALLAGKSPLIFGDGEHSRDFTYVANVVEANLLAAETDSQKVCGLAFNVAAGDCITLNQLLDQLNRAMNQKIVAKYQPSRLGDVRATQADIRRAHDLLGYVPKVNWIDGLQPTIDYYRSSKIDSAM